MEMMHRSFEQRLAKARLAEMMVQTIFEAQGWIRYAPTTPGAHAFDGLLIKDKRVAFAFDVKAKSRLNTRAATGIDADALAVYEEFSKRHNMMFCLFFVDEHLRTIYGNSIRALEQPFKARDGDYPYTERWGKDIRFYSLEQMVLFAEIDESLCVWQKQNSQRSHNYDLKTETYYKRKAVGFRNLIAQQAK